MTPPLVGTPRVTRPTLKARGLNGERKTKIQRGKAMKIVTKTLLCVCGLALLPLVLSAAKDQKAMPEYKLQEYRHVDLTLPIPEKVVMPRLRGEFVGHTVRMKLTVGADGRVYNIAQKPRTFDEVTNSLAVVMKSSLKQWEFEPALDKAGNPIAVKIILPVEVVKAKRNTQTYTALALSKPILIARAH